MAAKAGGGGYSFAEVQRGRVEGSEATCLSKYPASLRRRQKKAKDRSPLWRASSSRSISSLLIKDLFASFQKALDLARSKKEDPAKLQAKRNDLADGRDMPANRRLVCMIGSQQEEEEKRKQEQMRRAEWATNEAFSGLSGQKSEQHQSWRCSK